MSRCIEHEGCLSTKVNLHFGFLKALMQFKIFGLKHNQPLQNLFYIQYILKIKVL